VIKIYKHSIIILCLLNTSLFGFEIIKAKDAERITKEDTRSQKILTFFPFIENSLESVVSIGLRNNNNHLVGAGSGVIISYSGYIVTNYHVIKNTKNINVYLRHSKQPYSAKVVGFDNILDIAVIKINSSHKLKPIKFADSDKIKLADIVFAIGNPFGLGTTISQGIISATNKHNIGIYELENLIQTDAAINKGNSGGALINNIGQLIGINSAIYSKGGGYDGIGFAIPSNTIEIIVKSIIEKGNFKRGYLGVSLNENYGQVEIDEIDKNSAADNAGLKKGDIIQYINGKHIDEIADIAYIIGITPLGKNIEITILRHKKQYKKLIKLKEK
jgi:serine protease Do